MTEIPPLLICAYIDEFYMFNVFWTLLELSSMFFCRLTTKYLWAMLKCCIVCTTMTEIPPLLISPYLNEFYMSSLHLKCSGHSWSCPRCYATD
jgi:hypothetical protein